MSAARSIMSVLGLLLLTISAYPLGDERNASAAPSRSVKFATLPPGSTLPTDGDCASAVRLNPWEPRPDNTAANNRNDYLLGNRLTGSYLAQYGYEARVTGNFTGTTDEIIQWGACKWGFDEDTVRAVAVVESYWHQSQLGDCGVNTQPGTNGCASVGLLQVKGADIPPTHPGTWPYAFDSTSFNVDYALGVRRSCYEGKESWLGVGYTAGNDWKCMGRWYSGNWNDASMQNYLYNPSSGVQFYYNTKPWITWGYPGDPTGTPTPTPGTPGTITRSPTPGTPGTRTITLIPTMTPTPMSSPIIGDINGDGIVDIRDYGMWRQNFGASNCGYVADLNRDCLVDIRDYAIWRLNFGHTAGAVALGAAPSRAPPSGTATLTPSRTPTSRSPG